MQFEGKSLHGDFYISSKVVQKDKNTLKTLRDLKDPSMVSFKLDCMHCTISTEASFIRLGQRQARLSKDLLN